jgi:hypothetical protein
LFVVFALGVQTASAQITVTIPKIPKIKKDKPNQETSSAENQPNRQTSDSDLSSNESKTVPSPDKCTSDVMLNFQINDIAERQREVEQFKPGNVFLVRATNDNHLLYSISPKERRLWLEERKLLEFKDCPNLIEAYNKLAAAASKVLPQFVPPDNYFAFRNAAEEKMMLGALKDSAALKIHKIGLYHGSWLIDKNSLGVPIARYKQGYIWAKDPSSDHPYCFRYQINIIQDYSGGGTYAASYARFLGRMLVGCPAEK